MALPQSAEELCRLRARQVRVALMVRPPEAGELLDLGVVEGGEVEALGDRNVDRVFWGFACLRIPPLAEARRTHRRLVRIIVPPFGNGIEIHLTKGEVKFYFLI